MLGANDRKMQKSSNSSINANKLFVAPRDHFLDNAGMSDSESDLDVIEEGMLIEAPVTPEKSLPASGSEGDTGPAASHQAASQQGNQEASERADDAADGNAGSAGPAGKVPEAGRHDEGMEKQRSMGAGSHIIPCTLQVRKNRQLSGNACVMML